MTDTRPDAEQSVVLLQRAREGDAEALDRLVRRYLPRLRRWASGRLPAGARGALETDDVVQQTVLKALRHFDRLEYHGEGAVGAYLREALKNEVIDIYRRAARQPERKELGTSLPGSAPSPLEEAIGAEALDRYEASLQRLKPEDREAIVMRVEMGCEYGEIAEELGKGSSAHARVAVSRALARLAKEMGHRH